jgi:hypothetical protein
VERLIFTSHALTRMKEREISRQNVSDTVRYPDHRYEIKLAGSRSRKFEFVKRLGSRLLRVVFKWKRDAAPKVVITAHWEDEP